MVDYINNSKSLKTKPINLSNKSKCIACCSELLFGILYYSSYIDLEKMKVISYVVKK